MIDCAISAIFVAILRCESGSIGKRKPSRFRAPCGVLKINATGWHRSSLLAIFSGAGAQDREQSSVGIAVGQHSRACLDFANIVPQIEIDLALEIIHFIAECRERVLQLHPFIARHGLIVVGPGRDDNRPGQTP